MEGFFGLRSPLGEATGATISRALLEEVSEAAGNSPVFIGSGMSPERAEDLAPLAHGANSPVFIGSGMSPERAEDLAPLAHGAIVMPLYLVFDLDGFGL